MKIIKKKERGYRYYSEKMDLSEAYAGKKGVSSGTLILYVLVKDCDTKFESLSAEAEGELREEHNILNVSDPDFFSSVNNISHIFETQELRVWELTCNYKGVKIHITGRTHGSILSIRSPLSSDINFLPLMIEAETATYSYHDYDPATIEAIKKKFKINQKVTIQTLTEMEKYRDIFDEFMNGMSGDSFIFPDTNAVSVEGFTAQYLHENYPLSEIGAYNYLIYLRNDPEQAKKDLKNGLPRK